MGEPGGVRIGDAERQAAVDMLRHHTVEGRLTLDEFSDLVGQVYAAMTRGELDQVIADLPEGVRPAAPGSPPDPAHRTGAPSPGMPGSSSSGGRRRGERRRRFVAIMSGSQARGAWRAPPQLSAFAWWGSVHIDLRSALIESPVVEITAWAIMGSVTVTVPPGIPVELDGFVLMGGSENRTRAEDPIPDAPVVRVRGWGLWGGVTVRNPRRRRSHGGGSDWRDGGHGYASRHVERALEHAERHVERALDRAQRSTERALGRGSETDRIPRMPDPRARDHERARTAGGPQRSSGRPDAPSPAASATPGSATASTNGDAPATVDPAPPPPPAPPTRSSAAATTAASDSRSGSTLAASSPASDAPGRAEPPGDKVGRIPSGTLTMLVSDIAGSTEMAEQLGDQAWIEVLHAHNAMVRQRVADHGGTEVKAQGDGFLMVFPSARGAVLAAIDIQRAMRDYCDQHPELPVQVRLGLHTGEVVVADDDVFGRNVVAASRIAGTAEPGEIVVSGLTRDLTASASDLGFDDGQDVQLKGMPQQWRVHRVLWT